MEASALYPEGRFVLEDLLDFNLGVGDEDDDEETKTFKAPSTSSSNPSFQDTDDHLHQSLALPEFVVEEEEELEWLLNKDAFPAVETCLDILPGNPGIIPNHRGLLENSSSSSSSTNNSNGSTITSCFAGRISVPVRYPVKARSKRRSRRRHGITEQWLGWSQAKAKPELPPPSPPSATTTIGRRCLHCRAEKTPQWRAGPMGPKTLCNACGVRYKSGRLVPEYRPASSPTFSGLVHSNSHRKIIEMRKQKQLGGTVNEACGYRVG